MKKLEITTTSACSINCSFCPHYTFYKKYLKKIRSKKYMDFSVYKTCVDKLSSDVVVSFGGFSEPFQNKHCTEMVLYAKERKHAIEIFTTLTGLDLDNLNRILDILSSHKESIKDKIYVHLPSNNYWEHIPVDQKLIDKINILIKSNLEIDFHYHGERIHKSLQGLNLKKMLNHTPLHNRSFNETSLIKKDKYKIGRISCMMNMEVNLLIPNGDVILCCQDFGLDYRLGNLKTDEVKDLYNSIIYKNVRKSLDDDSIDSICRYCCFAIEHEI